MNATGQEPNKKGFRGMATEQATLMCTKCGVNPRRPPSISGSVYYQCKDCERKAKAQRYQRNKLRDMTPADATPDVTPDPVNEPDPTPAQLSWEPRSVILDAAPAPLSRDLATAEADSADSQEPPRDSDAAGVLADVLLLAVRSQRAMDNGQISALRISVDSGATRFHIGTERIRTEESE